MQTIGNQLVLFWDGLTGLLGRILGSRKLILGIISLALLIVVNLAPELSARAEQLGNLIFAIASAGIFGIALEDSVQAWANRPKTAQEALGNITAELQPQTTATPGGGQTVSVTVPPANPPVPPEEVAKGAA